MPASAKPSKPKPSSFPKPKSAKPFSDVASNISKTKPSSIRTTFSELADGVLLSEREAAAVAGYTPLTFKRWRHDGKGPPWLRDQWWSKI